MPSSPSQSQFTPPSLRDRAVSGNSASSRIIEQFPDDYRNDLPKIQNVLGSTRGNLETGYISS
jgi:hypothetical protein